MKKILLLLLAFLSINCAYAEYQLCDVVTNMIDEGQQVGYIKETKKWTKDLSQADLIFTKHWSSGTGAYSFYTWENAPEDPNLTGTAEELKAKKTPEFETGTNYEFLCQSRLIGCNIHKLQFYRLYFDGEKFSHEPLSDKRIKAHFPGVELVKVSQFKNNEITLYKPFFAKRTYMLINDTDRDFYKYFFENYVGENNFFKNIFEIRLPRTLVYSHFKSTDPLTPPLIIHIKGTFINRD